MNLQKATTSSSKEQGSLISWGMKVSTALWALWLLSACSSAPPPATVATATIQPTVTTELTATVAPSPTATFTVTPEPTAVPTLKPTVTSTAEPTLTSLPTIPVPLTTEAEVEMPIGPLFYISKMGDNSDGRSWDTAWSELDQIDWSVVEPGATIFIDGGPEQMVYEGELEIEQSGTADAPLTIKLATEEGRDGQAVFFGGRSELLPYCGQPEFDDSNEENLFTYGIRTNDHAYINIDGSKWRGIVIHGYERNGIRIDQDSHTITVKYVEIYNNGEAVEKDDGWTSDQPGVRLGGANITFARVIIHDNGQDAFQSLWDQNNISNFHLEQSWLYNGRVHPTVDESANYCTHTDGIQIYDGGVISGITIEETIIGPGFTQSIILGQTPTSNGSWADVHNVTLRDVLFTKAADNSILGYRDTDSSNWIIDHVTAHCPKTKTHCLKIDNANHSVTNSIIVGGRITFFDGLDHFEHNCQWETEGFTLGEEADPHFANVSETDHFSLDDYKVNPDSGCQGSRITSVEQLLNLK